MALYRLHDLWGLGGKIQSLKMTWWLGTGVILRLVSLACLVPGLSDLKDHDCQLEYLYVASSCRLIFSLNGSLWVVRLLTCWLRALSSSVQMNKTEAVMPLWHSLGSQCNFHSTVLVKTNISPHRPKEKQISHLLLKDWQSRTANEKEALLLPFGKYNLPQSSNLYL